MDEKLPLICRNFRALRWVRNENHRERGRASCKPFTRRHSLDPAACRHRGDGAPEAYLVPAALGALRQRGFACMRARCDSSRRHAPNLPPTASAKVDNSQRLKRKGNSGFVVGTAAEPFAHRYSPGGAMLGRAPQMAYRAYPSG